MKFIFFLSLFVIFYTYIGYLILIVCFSLLKRRRVNKFHIEPSVSIIIPAYNEEANIEATIRNKLNLDYPEHKLEIIVVSDGSTDRTDEIASRYASNKLKLLRQEPRAGKTSAIELALRTAKGEIIVFSDANSIYSVNALQKLVQNFADPQVGYVTGKMVYSNKDETTVSEGCSVFMRYENLMRHFETQIGSIVGVDGGIDAVRKDLYKPMRPDQLPDFVLPLKVVEQGFRVVYESEAILKEPALNNPNDEYKMRVRVVLRALWALSDMRHLLLPNRYGFFSFQLWSHKVLRYLCFIFLISAWVTNLFILDQGVFYIAFFSAQTFSYCIAALSPVLEKREIRNRIMYLCHYFALLNLASTQAFVKFIMKEKRIIWTPRKG